MFFWFLSVLSLMDRMWTAWQSIAWLVSRAMFLIYYNRQLMESRHSSIYGSSAVYSSSNLVCPIGLDPMDGALLVEGVSVNCGSLGSGCPSLYLNPPVILCLSLVQKEFIPSAMQFPYCTSWSTSFNFLSIATSFSPCLKSSRLVLFPIFFMSSTTAWVFLSLSLICCFLSASTCYSSSLDIKYYQQAFTKF